MNPILHDLSIKDLVWEYKYLLDEFLQKDWQVITKSLDSPEIIASKIADKEKQFAEMSSKTMQELVKAELERNHRTLSEYEANLTDEQKVIREECNKTITELEQWRPQSESSEHVKAHVIQMIKDKRDYLLYEWTCFPEPYTAEQAEKRVTKNKVELENWIKRLKHDYPIAVEYYKQLLILENQLKEDLELLPSK